jgi:predicted dehydrogenase
LEVYGELGTLVLENTGKDYARGFRVCLGTRESPRLANIEVSGDDTSADGRIYPVSRITSRFIEAILSQGKTSPGLEEGLRVQVLLDALRLAHQGGAWQDVGFA